MTYPPTKQMYTNGFVWERQEHQNGISWVRFTDILAEQDMSYCFFRNSKAWYFYRNSKTKGEIVSTPNIESLYLNLHSC